MDEGRGSEDDGSRAGDAQAASGSDPQWEPCGGAFRRYTRSSSSSQSSAAGASLKSSTLPVIVKRPLVARLTSSIVETFQICNPNFKYSEALNPKLFLTNPSVGVLNNGYDNANSDLILYMNVVLVNMESKQRYVVKDILGQGTFGQVAKCWISETNSYVAVKIIKNLPAYYQQALVEVSILNMLNQKFDPDDKHHIVRILDYFVYQQHLCISFEMLGSNLYELIKMNHFKGLSLSIVQVFSKQILHALVVMKDAGIIHCDLKPENILISTSVKPAEIKIIDFGSACMESRTVYSYIQSRYYRSPEVLLGYPYTTAIDMWSFGCIVAELFLGLPLFPGASEYDLLKRMIEILGAQPPDDLLRDAKNTSKYFKHVGSIYRLEDDEAYKGITSAYRVLTEEECEAVTVQKELKRPLIGKRYFNYVKLEDIIANYPCRKSSHEEEITKEKETRLALVDLLRGLLEFDPGKRWSPLQASRHPFVTGERFTCPYRPPPETPRISVSRTVTVDHNPGGGHWLAAGLSPQVLNANKSLPHNSPRFQKVPLSHGGTYGSLGSHGSYSNNAGLRSSYGSYGDISSVYTYYSPVGPSGLNIHAQVGRSILGASPGARCRPQLSHGNGFGVNPTGSLGPMSLAVSPSQFTPPSSQMQYASTSPARGRFHGPPLGKSAAVGQYNRRRNGVYPGNLCMQPHEITSQHWQGHHSDAISCSHQDAYSRGHVGSPRCTISISNVSNWRQQVGGGNELSSGLTPGNYQNFPGCNALHTNVVASHSTEESCGKSECSSSVPDPADWDPCYRTDELFQASSLASGSPPSAHDMHAGYSRLPRFRQNSASRFGQQSHRVNHMHPTSIHSEQNHQRSQPARSNYSMADTHSSANAIYGNAMSWGKST